MTAPTADRQQRRDEPAEDEQRDEEQQRERDHLGAREVLLHLLAGLLADDLRPADGHARAALEPVDDRLVVRVRAQRDRDVARAPVARDQLARPARLVRVDARDLRPLGGGDDRAQLLPARRASRPAAPSRTSAITSGFADAPVASAIASRAWTASADGGSKSSSESSSPATGPPIAPATNTSRTAPTRKRRRRRNTSRASESSMWERSWGGREWAGQVVMRISSSGVDQAHAHSSLSAIAARSSDATTLSSIPCAKNCQTRSGSAPDSRVTSRDDLAVAGAHAVLDHRVRAGGVALHLEQQHRAVLQQLDVGLAHRGQRLGLRHALGGRAERLDDALVAQLVAGEEQLALRLEEAEQVGLGDAGLARDRLRRGAAVAAERELLHRQRDDLGAPLVGGLAGAGRCREPSSARAG